MSAAKKNVRFRIYVLLVLCLLPVVTNTQLPFGLQDAGAGQRNNLFTPVPAGCEDSVFILDRRTKFNSLDEQLKEVLILGQTPFEFTREFLTFPTEYNASFTHRADVSVIPIRAPPCLRKLKS